MKNETAKPPVTETVDQALFLIIRGKYPSFTTATKRIADYILSNDEETKYLSISSMAKNIGVSESMITRFVRSLGLKSFQEFKVRLALNDGTKAADSIIFGELSLDDNAASVCQKIYNNNIETLKDSLSILNFKDIERAADLIARARKVDFYGSGSSGVAIANAEARFIRIGVTCFVTNDSHLQLMSAALLTDKDVAVGISNSGRSISIIESLAIAKKAGASTICITNYEDTPLSRHADIKLFTSSRDSELLSESIHSRIAELSLLDSLYVIVASKLKSSAVESIRITAEIIRSHRVKKS